MSSEAASRRRALSGWGRTVPTGADVVLPAVGDDVSRALAAAGPRGIIARGLGRSYGDAAQNAGGAVVDMTSLDCAVAADWETGVVEVDAGLGLDKLMELVIPHGWFPPVLPGTRNVTVGGAIAADIHGKNHHVDGSFCDHVVSFDLLAPSGTYTGVSAATNPEVFWATAGGMGLTGIVTRAVLQLVPVETAYMTVATRRIPHLDELMETMEATDAGHRYAVAWFDSLATGANLGRGILMHAEHTRLDDLEPARRHEPLDYSAPERVQVPPLPVGVVNRFSIGAFNWAWYTKSPRNPRTAVESVPAYFHPLDGVTDWNRLYGPRGFLQYQFVVPFGAEATVRYAVERLAHGGAASPVTVLKRFGRANAGMLSFPMEGWTLTLDIPTRTRGLAAMLDELDQHVLAAGGRIYLAKDSRVDPDVFAAMYPELDRWREVRAKLDPDGVMRSDLARRLRLV
ncbi:MAG: FAD-binding oxidoreductase [Acidimicrobiia bacterium]|nr:FAD-binding oxidoreductase [Acidimicrobiia bacterium]